MKKKILVLPSDRTGVGYFRSLAPHRYMAEHYGDDFDIDIMYDFPNDQDIADFIMKYDIVHFHKMLDKDCKLLELIKFLGVKTVMDIDDYWDLGDFHPMAATARKNDWKTPIINHIKMSDYVTTTTDIFANEIKRFNKNVYVFPNAIDPTEKQFIPDNVPSKKIRFGIICGSTHYHDIALINGISSQLSKDVLEKVQFVLCGFDTNGRKTILLPNNEQKVVPIEPKESVWVKFEEMMTSNYAICSPEYTKALKEYKRDADEGKFTDETYRRCWTKPIDSYATHYNNIDVLLVPLRECNFNKMKSQLKVIEAGFFNKGIIAQNYGPYTIDLVSAIDKGGNVNPKGNALLVDTAKNHKQWAKYITRIVNDPELLAIIRKNLHEHVVNNYTLDKICGQRADFYKNI